MYIIQIILCFNALNLAHGFLDSTLTFSHANVGEAVDINIHFRTSWDLEDGEIISISMPRFTDGRAVSLVNDDPNVVPYDLQLEPSRLFTAAWVEGNYDNNDEPFLTSQLLIQKKPNVEVPDLTIVDIIIYAENGIRAYCGFPAHDAAYDVESTRDMEQFIMESSTSVSQGRDITDPTVTVTLSQPQMGLGCELYGDCNSRGKCDFCRELCVCDEGWGAPTDVVMSGSSLSRHCFHRVCPSGKAIVDIPSAATSAHALAECSNMGICDRSTGECECFPPYTGRACERLGCPNDCSGHGQCVSMRELAGLDRAMPLIKEETTYGYATDTVAWDADIMHACVCDSSWEVGFGPFQTQLPEYFGADCSLRRCPSGDNPHTQVIETDCWRANQTPYGTGIGTENNLCHVDCSNRGTCDYSTGKCRCYDGSSGYNCGDLPSPFHAKEGF